MPIGNITQTMSTISPPPHRGVDVQTVFVNKQEDFQDHLADITIDELNTLKDQLNSRIGEINSTTTTMNGYADTASAEASEAITKAGEASTSASEALTSRDQASTFATNASNSATKASQWADNNYNVEVETGKYSAKHWSTVAQNTAESVSNFGFKNYIINGNFDVWQRGDGPFTNYNYGADRWITSHNTASMYSSSTGTAGVQKRIAHITNVTAGTTFITQAIELPLIGFGSPFSIGKKFTVSVRYSGTTKIRPSLIFRDGVVGSNPVKLDSTMTSPIYKGGSDVAETVSWTFTVDNVAAITNNCLVLSLLSESAPANVYIYNVQLEEGSIATPFEQRPIGLELSLCQRYYEVGTTRVWGSGFAGASVTTTAEFKVSKRVLPTLSYTTQDNSNTSGIIQFEVNTKDRSNGFTIVTIQGNYFLTFLWKASSEL